jgi:glutathione S-transferase
VKAKLYVILGSHACRTGMLMLEHKGIEYDRIELPTGLHPMFLRLRGFSGNPAPFRRVDEGRHRMLESADRMGTVPALLLDGQRAKTNGGIARLLDEVRPDPPLFPEDPERRREVEEAVRWGDEVLQMAARRLALGAVLHGPDLILNRGDDGRLGPLLWRSQRVRVFGVRVAARIFDVDAYAEGELLNSVPGMLDRVDAWIEAGVLDSEELNAADFMIAPSLALLSYRVDLRPLLDGRPSLHLVDRLLPEEGRGRAPIAAAAA